MDPIIHSGARAPGGFLHDVLGALDMSFNADTLAQIMASVTPDNLGSIVGLTFTVSLVYAGFSAICTKQAVRSACVSTGAWVLTIALAALSILGIVPMTVLAVASPVIVSLSVYLGLLPGILLIEMQEGFAESKPSLSQSVSDGILNAEITKAVEAEFEAMSEASRALLHYRFSLPFTRRRHARTPAAALAIVRRAADPYDTSVVENLFLELKRNSKLRKGTAVGVGAIGALMFALGWFIAGGAWTMLALFVAGVGGELAQKIQAARSEKVVDRVTLHVPV